MICRFVADSLGLPRRGVRPEFSSEILTAAATNTGMSPTDLDHAVWQYQRGRKRTVVSPEQTNSATQAVAADGSIHVSDLTSGLHQRTVRKPSQAVFRFA